MRKILILIGLCGAFTLQAQTTAEYIKQSRLEGDPAVRVTLLTQALTKNPNSALALHHRADAYREMGIPNDKVEFKADGNPYDKESGEALTAFPAKMSKSLRNVVNPDEVIRQYGADSMRLYEMFMGPLEAVKPWSTKGVEGVFRFLKRIWRMIAETPVVDTELTKAQLKILHQTIQKVTTDTETLNFNTAISQMMIFVNEFSKLTEMPRAAAEPFVKLLCPYAPHIAEELWEIMGNKAPVSLADWPSYDPALLVEDEAEILVQINGKPKARIMMPASAAAPEMEKLARADAAVQAAISGKNVVKVICVPKRIVNLVVK